MYWSRKKRLFFIWNILRNFEVYSTLMNSNLIHTTWKDSSQQATKHFWTIVVGRIPLITVSTSSSEALSFILHVFTTCSKTSSKFTSLLSQSVPNVSNAERSYNNKQTINYWEGMKNFSNYLHFSRTEQLHLKTAKANQNKS